MSQLISRILSGGQTGVDRAALDLALEHSIPCGGWCPKGRRAEDGSIDARYPLEETPSSSYEQRTQWNVRDSDGTLVLLFGKASKGTSYTVFMARKYNKPVLKINLADSLDKQVFLNWIEEHNVSVLNIAGPRESHEPGVVYEKAKACLSELLSSA